MIKRCLLALVGAVALATLVVAAWLLGHLRKHHDHFLEGQGALLVDAAEVVQTTTQPIVSEYVTIASTTGLRVSFRVLRPPSAATRVPVVVLLAGHRTGRDAVDLVGDPGPIAVVAMDYPYHGPERFDGILETLGALPAMQRGLLDTPPAVSLVADWLERQAWVDRGRMELLGGSLGVPFAAVAGANDPRFRRVWLVHGGADNRAWLNGVLRDDISNQTLRTAAAAVLYLVAHGTSFDTAWWTGRIAPRPVVVIGARDDESLAPENIQTLYEAAGDPRRLVWTAGGHVTRHNTEAVRQILEVVRQQIDSAETESGR